MKLLKSILLIVFAAIFIGCECPTSDNIDSRSEALVSTSIAFVDATGSSDALRIDIADVNQMDIPMGFEYPFEGKLETGRQIVSIYSADSYYYSGTVETQENTEYIGILDGEPLFGNFYLFSRDTMPQLSIFNATDEPFLVNGTSLESDTYLGITQAPNAISGISLTSNLSSGMLVITAISGGEVEFVEVR